MESFLYLDISRYLFNCRGWRETEQLINRDKCHVMPSIQTAQPAYSRHSLPPAMDLYTGWKTGDGGSNDKIEIILWSIIESLHIIG